MHTFLVIFKCFLIPEKIVTYLGIECDIAHCRFKVPKQESTNMCQFYQIPFNRPKYCTICILNKRQFKKLFLSATRSALLSVDKPTEHQLGLVREKKRGREVGTIADPDLVQVGGRQNKSGQLLLLTIADFSGSSGLLEVVIIACTCTSSSSCLESPL